jgi:indole-3-glycerol phosphate synthase
MAGVPSILHQILQTKAEEIAAKKASSSVQEMATQSANLPDTRGFGKHLAMVSDHGLAVIAELKKASPSAGIIRQDFLPRKIAESYQRANAACLSVLTDAPYFQGADGHLELVRQACSLPILRKDFLIDPWQVYESRVLGADCVLLIVAALEKNQLQALEGLAGEIGLDVLVEVHDEMELEAALSTGAAMIGVNNRNLNTFTTDLGVSERLNPMIPADRTMVTESGIHTRADVDRLSRQGIQCFLVGEAFMRAGDPGLALQALFY